MFVSLLVCVRLALKYKVNPYIHYFFPHLISFEMQGIFKCYKKNCFAFKFVSIIVKVYGIYH
jgi:hypothetical protein